MLSELEPNELSWSLHTSAKHPRVPKRSVAQKDVFGNDLRLLQPTAANASPSAAATEPVASTNVAAAPSAHANGAAPTPRAPSLDFFDALRTVSAISIFDDAEEAASQSHDSDDDDVVAADDADQLGSSVLHNSGVGTQPHRRARTETVGDWTATLGYVLEEGCQKFGQCGSMENTCTNAPAKPRNRAAIYGLFCGAGVEWLGGGGLDS